MSKVLTIYYLRKQKRERAYKHEKTRGFAGGGGGGMVSRDLRLDASGGGGALGHAPPLVDTEKSIYNMLRPLPHAGDHKIYCMPAPPPPPSAKSWLRRCLTRIVGNTINATGEIF